jgi:hypothetical protein
MAEPFGLHDNLLVAGAITDGCLAIATVAPAERYTALGRSSTVLNGRPFNWGADGSKVLGEAERASGTWRAA